MMRTEEAPARILKSQKRSIPPRIVAKRRARMEPQISDGISAVPRGLLFINEE